MRTPAVALIASLAVACLAAAVPQASAARGLELGYFDPDFTWTGREPLLDQAAQDGATIVRIEIPWPHVAPVRPARPEDPSDPAYDWSLPDAAAVRAAANGLDVVFCINKAPAWAEGPGRPDDAEWAWKPDPAALGAFARAAATRYSGRTPGLPRVWRWQVWNEPNLARYLAPQWKGRRNAAAPRYRRMVNAVHGAVKAVDRRAIVIAGGTAPFGDPPGGERTHPVAFFRDMLRRRTRFDAWAHHPYGRNPRHRAIDRQDASVPDLGRIARVVARAARAGTAPRGTRPWVTEIGWDSRPPDPDGIAAAKHARWLSATLFTFWRSRATHVLWLQVRDDPPEPSYPATNQSGTHLVDGTDKPTARAFRFPFAVSGPSRGRVRAWGMAPDPGRVRVQRRAHGRWRTVARARARGGRVFTTRLRAARGDALRAVQRDTPSLAWRVGVDG